MTAVIAAPFVGAEVAASITDVLVDGDHFTDANAGLANGIVFALGAWMAGVHLEPRIAVIGAAIAGAVAVEALIQENLWTLFVIALLALVAMAGTVLAALALGVTAARNHGRPGDWAIMGGSQLGVAIPAFWLAILLVLLFAVQLRWLPPGGFPGWQDPAAALRALILPAASVALVQSAILARGTRSSILEVMRLDYARTARAKGLDREKVLRRHVLPNALIPIITITGLQFANLVTGTIVIENVFYLPGLGRLIFQSIVNRDLFTVQALVLGFAFAVVAVNFLVDVAYLFADPRLRGDAR